MEAFDLGRNREHDCERARNVDELILENDSVFHETAGRLWYFVYVRLSSK
jgi:hypothetical protein